MSIRIVIVDDEPSVLMLLPRLLHEPSWEVITFLNPLEALASIQADPPDVLLTDIRMPDMNGYELICAVRVIHPFIVCGVMSGWGMAPPAHCPINFEVQKPEGIKDIRRHIEAAIASLQRCA